MFLNQVLGRAAVLVGALVAASSAEAACNYSSPSVGLSVQSPGSPAGVQVGVMRISATVTAGSLQTHSSDSHCSSYNGSGSAAIYLNNRYIGSNIVDINSASFPDGLYLLRADGHDNNGGYASAQQQIWIRNNGIHPAVFNLQEYINLNPDLAAAFGGDPGRTMAHWLYFGIREGRQAHLTFRVNDYLEGYQDLIAAFGADYPRAIDHYIQFGASEGRVGHFLLRPEVFNVHYYYAIHPDLQAAFPGDVEALKRHFVTSGINEGRKSKENFTAPNYLNRHADLLAAFGGGNYRAAAKHYVQFGQREGRNGN